MTTAKVCLWTFLGILLCGTATWANAGAECPKGLNPVTEFRLFFGLTDSAGNTVTKDEWRAFLADHHTTLPSRTYRARRPRAMAGAIRQAAT